MNVMVRPAAPADLDALCVLLEQLFTIEQDFRPDRGRQLRGLRGVMERDDAVILVAAPRVLGSEMQEVVGMLSVQSVTSTAEGGQVGLVEDVVVADSHRNQGIGVRLLEEAEAWARARGLRRLQLLADRDNTGAQRFYDRQGWQATRLQARRKMLG